MIDRVLSHGFAGAEEVSPSEKSDGIGDGAEVGSSAAVQVADGENTATCQASPEAGDLEVKLESDTNEANFDAHVINSQTPEILGVTAELAVGAGLDSVVGMHVLSPDLVCPDSQQGSGEETLVAGADEGNTATCAASPEVGDLDVKPASDANEGNLHGPVAGICVGVGRVPGAENGGLPAEKQQSRGGGIRLSQMTEREKVQAMRERRRKNMERVLDAQKKLRDLASSSPEIGEMMRQQLPREP